MNRKKLNFTFEDVKEELALIANLLSSGVITSFGENFYLSVMNMPLKSFENNDDSVTSINFTIKDISDAPITHDVYCAYIYAEGRRYGDTNNPDNFLDGMGEFYSFVQGSVSLIEDSKFKFLYDLTSARATLDNGDYLSIKELALLACVDERTVRNAASSKEANKLETKKSGGSTIIENEEAIRWLSDRPGFKPTQYIKDTTFDTPRYFEDEVGFGKYVTYCMQNKSISSEDVAELLNVEVSIITDLKNGVDGLYIKQVGMLAEILGENIADFIKDYMRVFHVRELADLSGIEHRSRIDNSDNNAHHNLIIFEQQLKFDAQERILKLKTI